MSEQNFIIKNGELKKYIGNSENVIIPEQITRIGSCAFEDNIYIKTVTFPETVKKISFNAFKGCRKLAELIGFDKTKLTSISSGIFSDAKNLKAVKIPPTVQEIESGAFSGCDNLTEIVLPESLKKIGPSAFRGCNSIKETEIPLGCEEIDNYAFGWMNNLTKIVVPKTVKRIGVDVFPCARDSLCIWAEAGSYIASELKISEYNYCLTDENGTPIVAAENSEDDKYEMYYKCLKKAKKELRDPIFCYVYDQKITGYSVSENSDFDAGKKTLSELFQVKKEWEEIKNTGDLLSLFEKYALYAIAVAIAVKVYVCPDVTIELCFETSKYSREPFWWWIISPAEEEGRLFLDTEEYEDYLKNK